MAVKAVFVGIDRHQRPDVPELGGAKRDATALWALFTDSIPGHILESSFGSSDRL